MTFVFDTEFVETETRLELISIGIASYDGRVYYAESAEYSGHSTPWLDANVIPHLVGSTESRARIRDEIVEFVGLNPVFWAYYGAYDWVLLCRLFGTMMDIPNTWPGYVRDLKQRFDRIGDPNDLKPQKSILEHNALEDALWGLKFLQNLDAYERSPR